MLHALTAVLPMGLHVNHQAFSFHGREHKIYLRIYVEGTEEQFYGSSYSCRSIHGEIHLMALISDPFILSSVFTLCRMPDFPFLSVGVHTGM
jgi:hypothetical protein